MARKPRIHFPGALYHVIARGNRGQKIFPEEGDYRLYLKFLGEYKKLCRFLLYAYILMPDHIHLLLEIGETPLSRLMQSLQVRYSRNFNLKYNKKGHLFEGRYQAILCEKKKYLDELSAYIHANAVRSGLVSGPEEYPWSSYHAYAGQREDDLVDTQLLLKELSGNNRQFEKNRYRRFVMKRIFQGHRDDFYRLKDGILLGSDEFVGIIREKIHHTSTYAHDLSLPEIVAKTSNVLKIPEGMFYTSSRNRQGAFGRSVAGYMARKLGGMRIKSVADHFRRDPVVISQGINKLERRLMEERDIHELMLMLERELTGGGKNIPEA